MYKRYWFWLLLLSSLLCFIHAYGFDSQDTLLTMMNPFLGKISLNSTSYSYTKDYAKVILFWTAMGGVLDLYTIKLIKL